MVFDRIRFIGIHREAQLERFFCLASGGFREDHHVGLDQGSGWIYEETPPKGRRLAGWKNQGHCFGRGSVWYETSLNLSRGQSWLILEYRWHPLSCLLWNSTFGCRWHRHYSPNVLSARGGHQLRLSKDGNTEGASRVDDSQPRYDQVQIPHLYLIDADQSSRSSRMDPNMDDGYI